MVEEGGEEGWRGGRENEKGETRGKEEVERR